MRTGKIVKQETGKWQEADSRTTRRHVSEMVHISLLHAGLSYLNLIGRLAVGTQQMSCMDLVTFFHAVYSVSLLDRSNLTKDVFRNRSVNCWEN
jgi:hypothetical protein